MRALLWSCWLIFAAPVYAEQRVGLKVVELFTSQGCSSCPPADALLADWRETPGLLPLAYHVDYWNYLGWEDPLSAAFATERQLAYREALGTPYVYTPQFVVAGRAEFGLMELSGLVQSLGADTPPAPPMRWQGATLHLGPADAGSQRGHMWLIHFHDQVQTQIRAGENRGLSLASHHPVWRVERLGSWQGEAVALDLDAPEAYGLAVVVTNPEGHIIAAADWRLSPQGQNETLIPTSGSKR